jgi:hypothetical protein
MPLKTAREYATQAGVGYQGASTLPAIWRARGVADELGRTLPDAAAGQAVGPPVIAYANHGRWVGDCNLIDGIRNRRCLNAQLIDPGDPQFWCVVCFNGQVQGRWRIVAFPADPAAVETALDGLPAPEQNWTP